jgi:hypothetical protein
LFFNVLQQLWSNALKQFVQMATLVAFFGIVGCSKSGPSTTLKSVDASKTGVPKAVGGGKDKGSATSAPPVIQ